VYGRVLRSGKSNVTTRLQELHGISSLAFSHGTLLTGARVDPRIDQLAEIMVHDLDRPAASSVLASFSRYYDGISISGDGQRFLCTSGGRRYSLRSTANGRELKTVNIPGARGAAVIHPSGTALLSLETDGCIRFWDLESEPAHRVFRAAESDGRTFGVAALGDDRFLFTTSDHSKNHDSGLHCWNWRTGVCQHHPAPAKSGAAMDMAVSRDGATLAIAYWEGFVDVWNTSDMTLQRRLKSPHDRLSRVAVLDSGTVFALAVKQGVYRWEPTTPAQNPIEFLSHREAGMEKLALCLSPDEHWLAVAGHEKKPTVMLYDLRNAGNPPRIVRLRDAKGGVSEANTGYVTALCISPDSGTLAVALARPAAIQVYSIASQTLIRSHALPHDDVIPFLCFDADSTGYFSGSHDGTVKLWNVGFASELLTLKEHTAAVNRGVLSRSGVLATTSWDNTIRVWDGSKTILSPSVK
jgi:WD40 repeat protein